MMFKSGPALTVFINDNVWQKSFDLFDILELSTNEKKTTTTTIKINEMFCSKVKNFSNINQRHVILPKK